METGNIYTWHFDDEGMLREIAGQFAVGNISLYEYLDLVEVLLKISETWEGGAQ